MHEKIRQDILWILEKAIGYLGAENIDHELSLRELSTHTVHNASIFQDEDSVSIAVLTYTLSKLALKRFKGVNLGHLISHLKTCREELSNNDTDAFRASVQGLFTHLRTQTPHLRQYIEDVIVKARISKARHIHEHGISVTQTAHILGVNAWELNEFLGRTKIADAHFIKKGIPVAERLMHARRLFP